MPAKKNYMSKIMVEVMHIYFTGRGLKKNKNVSFYNGYMNEVSNFAIFDLVTYETERLWSGDTGGKHT